MTTVLFLVHTQSNGTLPKAALETLGIAAEIEAGLGDVTFKVGLLGGDVSYAANSIGAFKASEWLSVTGEDFADSRYSSDALGLEALVHASEATIVIAPATARFNRVMPGVAQRVGGRVDTHISGLRIEGGELEVQRWYYRQRMVATISREQRPWFLLVDSGVFPGWQQDAPNDVSLKEVPVEVPESCKRTSVVGLEKPAGEADTIRPDAELLFVAGAGWTKKQSDGQVHLQECERLVLEFLKTSEASLGSSKSLVDLSSEGQAVLPFMSHLNQVGQTGSTPRHSKGLATCCHGEEPHVVGWRFINERRAVNLDANCGWAHGKADVLYVADAFKVMEKVNQLLSNQT